MDRQQLGTRLTPRQTRRWPPRRHRPRSPPKGGASPAATLRPLVLDIAVPVGGYYLLRDGFGCGLVLSLALSAIAPAANRMEELVMADA